MTFAIGRARRRKRTRITAINPTGVVAGSPQFIIDVTGSDFVTGSDVQWNGSARHTTFKSRTHIAAEISASDIASVRRSRHPHPSPDMPAIADVQRRTLRQLCVSQVIGSVGVAVGMSVGALLAVDMANKGEEIYESAPHQRLVPRGGRKWARRLCETIPHERPFSLTA